MDEIAKLSNYWADKLRAIEPADPQQLVFEQAAGADKLQEFGALALIDSLVLKYPAYKHDDIFNMSLGLVYELMAIGKRRDRVSALAAQMRRKNMK